MSGYFFPPTVFKIIICIIITGWFCYASSAKICFQPSELESLRVGLISTFFLKQDIQGTILYTEVYEPPLQV